jgi:hypothetical protein
MSVVKDIQDKHNYGSIEFILVEHGEEKYSKDFAEKCGFKYEYHDDPLLTSHRSTLRNEAVNRANGEYVILHDNDIIPDEDFFEDIFKILNKKPNIEYFSNFKDVINLTDHLTNILIEDFKSNKQFKYGYINGTDPDKTNNFISCQVRPHGFWRFTEATGGSFTIKKTTYQKAPFDEKYQSWGAEDNAFKLYMIDTIGWDKFGMLNKTLLHSYHTTGNYNPSHGIIKIHNETLGRNRNMLYESIEKIEKTLDTEKYEEFIDENLNITLAQIKKED